MTDAEPAQLLGVDLHVESRRSLAPLHAALPHAQPFDVAHPKWVHLTGYGATRRARSANAQVRRLIALIEALPAGARRCWNEASRRHFDIGIQAGPEGPDDGGVVPFEDVVLEPDTLQAVARLKARVLVTVYPPSRAWSHTAQPGLGGE